ncbi:Chemotaxis response regulator protein-glutamate methylesterase (plasmid) [Gemmatirosa kalamazoonensis]|uniref:Protein-glutamate methylesterase/protein-glutamine glutaminase n=1 Tax=Gemmatirosa kalamazoonensis TaxID=861299 RepID=W0RSK2_9BACT|nr:chemotaxis-specific protein-glutamate methyltransferase CheB [Gemmatirosa kalamazoonensis]AHG93447.1 Chemotaxis response regulator protein-glutamate methylesterase [Gemmatirosa kalamazoonensis]
MPKRIRVLVVDDSAFVRKVVSQMLARSASIEVVGTARDGEDALDLTARLEPDVVTLDLMMPRMNGVEFLRAQAKRRVVPVVICSIAGESGAMALEAFEAGAVEFVQKPTALASDRVYEIADELIAKVEAASRASVGRAPADAHPDAQVPGTDVHGPVLARRAGATAADLVVLGISTGGPQALRYLIPRLPASFPVPVAMVLHMPVGYTAMYAERLNDISPLEVVEAADGDVLRPGVVWLAPAGRHLTFVRDPDTVIRAHLDLRPLDTPHRPAVDVLFQSAAAVFGPRVLGVVMTGMGNDGLLGAAHIKAQGGRIVTEAESSCVVYGMPRAVAEASLSDRSATLEEMAGTIAELI